MCLFFVFVFVCDVFVLCVCVVCDVFVLCDCFDGVFVCVFTMCVVCGSVMHVCVVGDV